MSKLWKPCQYTGWKRSWRLRWEDVELIAVGDIGPRILSLRIGKGPNLLWEDPSKHAGRGKWKNFGGHRLWIAPETEDTYLPDTGPCEAIIEGDSLTLTAPPQTRIGLKKSFRITPLHRSGWIEVSHRIENVGELVVPGALWSLTCVHPVGNIVFPWGNGSDSWQFKQITYWQRWAGQTSKIDSPQWIPGSDLFTVEPTGEIGKVGAAPSRGWVAQIRDDASFLKIYPVIQGAPYIDAGCSVEVFTSPKFMEMETLSPMGTFFTDDVREHTERWYIHNRPLNPSDLSTISEQGWNQ